jgi:3',5'-cyclic AMP phosphodiesterase CpdA
MYRLWGFAIVLALSILPLTALAADPLTVKVPPKFTFVAYGDVRFTDPSDHIRSNPEARRALVARIAQARPAFLLMTGDLVLSGGNPQDWKVWDAESRPLRDAGVPIFPVPGNHELVNDPQSTNYFAHFPELADRPWYSVRAGNVICFLLDSVADVSSGPQWEWLQGELSRVPADVDFLVFVLHHPPYTHSSDRLFGGGHSARPAERKLAAWLESRQPSFRPRMLVISGHVHNYERYEQGGVMYVVSGGGGATPYTVPRSSRDFYREAGPTYHYLSIAVDGRKLLVEMNKLEIVNGQAQWTVKDSFELEAAKAVPAAAR